jgi:hypothetical protein
MINSSNQSLNYDIMEFSVIFNDQEQDYIWLCNA